MGNRTIERAVARKLYDDFSKAWRRQKRLAGKYGEPGHRKPTFEQWHSMHQRNHEMMAQSTPQDVQEYLGLDPWAEEVPQSMDSEYRHDPQPGVNPQSEGERGVVVIPIVGESD